MSQKHANRVGTAGPPLQSRLSPALSGTLQAVENTGVARGTSLATLEVGMFARIRRLSLLVVGAMAVAACGAGNATGEPAVKSRLFITDRGIGVPVPPPSLKDNPKVEARIWGDITDDFEAGTMVHLAETVSGFETDVAADAGSCDAVDGIDEPCDFLFEDVPVDLADNCFEFWLAGEADAIAAYRADIEEEDDGTEVPIMVELDETCAQAAHAADANARDG